MATLFTSIHHKTPYDTRATRHSIQEANNTEKEIKSYLKEQKKSHKKFENNPKRKLHFV